MDKCHGVAVEDGAVRGRCVFGRHLRVGSGAEGRVVGGELGGDVRSDGAGPDVTLGEMGAVWLLGGKWTERQ